ncbi:MAG: hypothetical protein ACXW2R_08760, partial [Candidatus Aminicenantales bacterium]
VLFGAARADTAENRLFPTGSQPELYKVPAAGGRVVQVLGTPAEDAKLSADGRFIIYHDRKGGENDWRKHHKSAITRDIWAYDIKAGTHRKITGFAGEDRSPVLANGDEDFYYLSEESGTFNVHRMSVAGGPSTQVTKFKTNPVRFLSRANDGTLCFGYDGAIYTQRDGEASPELVNVMIAADARANNEVVVPVSGGASEFAVSPNGKEIAVVVRGGIFAANVDGGVTKRVTSSFGGETAVSFAPDGNALVYASERDGRWGIYETRRTRAAEPYFYASTVLRETPLVANARQNTQPAYSPDGKQLAFVEDRTTLRVLDLASKQTRTLLTDRELAPSADGSQYFAWSPDGQWILFDYAVPGFAPGEVGLVKSDGSGKIVNLTESGFEDRQAKWILGGQAMLWFSNRDGMKAVAYSGGAQNDAYALFFTRDAWDRFRLTKEEAALLKDIEEKRAKPEAPKDKKETADKEKKRGGQAPRHRLDRSGPAQGAPDHPLSVARRRPGQQGRRHPLLSRPIREGPEPVDDRPQDARDQDARDPQRQQRPHGLGQGAEVDFPAGRRLTLEDRSRERQARLDRHQGRDDGRRRRRAQVPVRARLAPGAGDVLLGGLSRRRLERLQAGLREAPVRHRRRL